MGKDFFFITFSYLFIKNVNLFAEGSDKCKNLPTFSSTDTINSMLYPFRLSIKYSMQFIVFSESITPNFVN